MKNKVSLQINLAPVDYPHARYLLEHQLRALAGQVNEIILTVDTRPSKGRFGEGWEKNTDLLDNFLSNEIKSRYAVKIVGVDYSPVMKRKVARFFFGTDYIPDKDFRGGPFYAYFFGLYTAANNLVFHLDSDLFIGGGSTMWVKEAVRFFEDDPSCFIIGPLPGPPHHADVLTDQFVIKKIAPYTWQLGSMSTRVFMTDKGRFTQNKLALTKPPLRGQIMALLGGNSNADLPEHIIGAYMHKHRLKRIDFLGAGKGLWSLHPPYRTGDFYKNLPELITRIEVNDLPAKQQGFYDIIDDVCDWAPARKKMKNNRWWRRI
ncbi:hypothetical protein [Mucilaginibacter aquariorum]|uniref:Glycosyltransferase family 2 protein n=1 Tax=Mucilaginibacter aquariorum TaxID=2967225 RepID=A0ABT1SYG1_9SPHI|nr:hypothetical protein [Mucilaginibacter aquariorum]MCQ6957292.1 hypothetical protein [Mucilaginibacter aquariorum]